jgi:O-antigen ligase
MFSMFPLSDVTSSAEQGFSIVKERFVSIGNGYDESFAWRGKVWESTLERFAPHPLLGIGFGASVPVELGEYRQYVEVRNMHNSWLALLIQTGVVGVALFLGVVLTFIIALARKALSDPLLRQVRFVVFGLLFFQGLVFFSQPYLETNLLGLFFWITLGVGRALLEFSEEREKQQIMAL